MQTLRVQQLFNAERADVFDVIADHTGYASLPGVLGVDMRETGAPLRDGVGAVRAIRLPGLTLVEQITEYVPGTALGYRIIAAPIPLAHEGARIVLEDYDGGTRAIWTSRLGSPTPLIGFALERILARQMALGYKMALRIWAHRLR